MFLITTVFQKSRSKKHPDKPGKVLFRIFQNPSNGKDKIVRTISSGIYGKEEIVFKSEREEIVRHIRMIYSIIENRTNIGQPFSIDEVVEDYRSAEIGASSMTDILKRAEKDFPLKADLVTVGNEFKRDFKFLNSGAQMESNNLLDYISFLSQQARNEGKQSKLRSYNSTQSSLSKFLNDKDIEIKNIDRYFVSNYSRWLKGNGVADSTQSFYLRTLRAIINHAKDDGFYTSNENLFSGLNTRVKFSPLSKGQYNLNQEILNKISTLKIPENPETEVVRDMFMFGFYCRGMELSDVLNLTNKNIQGDKLIFNRRSVGKTRIITLERPAQDILKKYRHSDNIYIFPLKEQNKGIRQYSINSKVSFHLKEIGNRVGFPELTFGMNISAWKQLMSQLNISELLLKTV